MFVNNSVHLFESLIKCVPWSWNEHDGLAAVIAELLNHWELFLCSSDSRATEWHFRWWIDFVTKNLCHVFIDDMISPFLGHQVYLDICALFVIYPSTNPFPTMEKRN